MFNVGSKLAKRVTRIEESPIRKMMMAGSKVPGAISLAQGIPDSRTPQYIRDGIIEMLKEDSKIGKYTLGPGLPELRKLVADSISKKGGFPVDPDKNVCITAGAIEALAITISSIVEEGDEVILFDPGYPPYIPLIKFAGGKPVLVPLQADNAWKIDLDKLRESSDLDYIRHQLVELPGVGPYTAELTIAISFRRPVFHLDLFSREAMHTFYFGGKIVPDKKLHEFVENRWGKYKHYAMLLLTTNTDTWAKSLGINFRLRSAAKSPKD